MLFLLEPEDPGAEEWNGYEIHTGFLIRAESQEQARNMAAEASSRPLVDNPWLDPHQTSCTNVENLDEGEPAVLLEDYTG